MGNVCCTDRRIKKEEKAPPAPDTSKPKTLQSNLKKSSKSIRIISNSPLKNEMIMNLPSLPPKLVQSIVDFNESLIEELEYDITEATDLSEIEREKILNLFTTYSNEVPGDEKEAFEGFSQIKIRTTNNSFNDHALLISNFAVYIVKCDDFNYLYRRVRLETILIILIREDIKAMILHCVNGELDGDLWIETSCIEDIHNCIQTMFRYFTQRYIPTYTYPESQFKARFNKIPPSLTYSLTNEENLKANNAVIQHGKIAENILLIKAGKTVYKGKFIDSIAVLTTKAFYYLNNDFRFVLRLEIKQIKGLIITDKVDKFVIEKMNGEHFLWTLNSKFVTEIEKIYTGIKREKLRVLKKDDINIDEYIELSLKNKRHSFTIV